MKTGDGESGGRPETKEEGTVSVGDVLRRDRQSRNVL